MSTETTKIQQLIDEKAQKQTDQEAREFLDLIIDYLAQHPTMGYSGRGGAIEWTEYKSDIICWRSADSFKEPLKNFVSDWKKDRFNVLQSEMTNDLLNKVNLLTP